MTDQGFPLIQYDASQQPREWGRNHGEQFREGIAELVEIRRRLMQQKNPGLTNNRIESLAAEQFQATQQWDADLGEELQGIAEGANLTMTEITVLNNYTDFRDIQVPDQGCSVVYVSYENRPVAGQTWDMHASAKRYVCCLEVPVQGFDQPMILFSLVGCVGMMGFHPSGQMIGVNNINTDGAEAGAMWPAIVRGSLARVGHAEMVHRLTTAPVTSGHSYLFGSTVRGEFWEVMPGLAERVSALRAASDGFIFHTNHCLGEMARNRETPAAMNSTTHDRFALIEKKIDNVRDFDAVYELLNDHENYPRSICSNFQTDAQDPSVTCGGAVGDLVTGEVTMWRGDEIHDDNFVKRQFQIR